jgi:hypothetical protein
MTNTSDWPWCVRSSLTSCSKAAHVGSEQVGRQPQPRHPRVVAVEAALEVAGHRRQAAVAVAAHADRVQLQRRHAVVVHQFPQLGQVLHQRRDDLARCADVAERVGDHEGLQPGQCVEGHAGDVGLVELFDRDAALVRQRDRRRAEARVVADREVHLVLGRHTAFEADAVGLGLDVAVLVLGEVQALLFGQCARQVGGAADQAGLALLADRALEERLDEDLAVAPDQVLDLVFAGVRAQHLGGGEARELKKFRSIEHSGEIHPVTPAGRR